MPLQSKPTVEIARLPLVGSHNTRQATAGSFLTGKDQRFVNFIPTIEDDPLTGSKKPYCVKRPGFEQHTATGSAAACTALHVWEQSGTGTTIMSAWGSTNSAIYENTTDKGDITGKARGFVETDVTGTATVVMASSDSSAWYFPSGGALTEITDVDFPAAITGNFVTMDGYLFIMATDGKIYNSDLNSITAWTSTGYVEPTLYPMQGVGLARHYDSIVAFGKSSIEFFVNVGNATGSPLGRRDSVVQSIGAVRPAGDGVTILQHENEVYFIGTSRAGGAGVYRIKGYTIEKVSTPVIDAQLEVSEPENASITVGRFWGRTHLVVHAGQSFALNLDDNVWWEIDAGIGTFIFAGSTHGNAILFAAPMTGTTGDIFQLNTDTPVYQDDGSAYTATIQTSKVDLNTENRKRFHKLKLLGDKQASTTTVNISWSDDDYGSFSSARSVDMSSNRAHLYNCGSGRRRAFKLTNATNTPCRLEALELVYSTMGN